MGSAVLGRRPLGLRLLALALLTLVRPERGWAQDGPFIEVEFEPAGPGDSPPPEELLNLLFNGKQDPSSHGHEDELDRAMEGMVAGMLSNVGNRPAQLIQGGGQSAQAGMQGAGPVVVMDGRSAMPVEAFRNLFPGPLIVEADGLDSPNGLRPSNFGGPDPLVLDMLREAGQSFQEEMLPAIGRAPGGAGAGGGRAPDSCQADLQAHCRTARSQLHCLGQHTADISAGCRKDVGRSVPFVCSRAIDQYCDVLQVGILSCLEGHMASLSDDCKDAVTATRDVITKTSTQKSSLVDRSTGAKKSVMPSAPLATGLPVEPKPSNIRYYFIVAIVLSAAAAAVHYALHSPEVLKKANGRALLRKLGINMQDDGLQPLCGLELPRPKDGPLFAA